MTEGGKSADTGPAPGTWRRAGTGAGLTGLTVGGGGRAVEVAVRAITSGAFVAAFALSEAAGTTTVVPCTTDLSGILNRFLVKMYLFFPPKSLD